MKQRGEDLPPNITQKPISPEDFAKILNAYANIESPCFECFFRSKTFCVAYETPIVEDSPDVFIPCDACENAVSGLV